MSLVAQTAATVVEVHCSECERSLQISASPDARPTWRGAHVRRRDDRLVGTLTGRANEQGVDGNREEGGRHGRLPRGSAIPREAEGPTTLAISARASSSSPGAHIRNGRAWSGAP